MSRIGARRSVVTVGILLSLLASGGATARGAPAGGAAVPASPAPAAAVSSTVRRSAFVLPVAGPAEVLTPFRAPADRYSAGHRGVDLTAALGGAVRASAAGTVVFAGRLAGRGVLSIDHPEGLRTTYEPVTASVEAGDPVAAGQAIGFLEAGHASCAPAVCLHWGARLPDGSYLDPMGLLGGLQVRLLPWDR